MRGEEIALAKKGWLQERQVSRATDRELASLLADHAYLGRALAWDGVLERKVLSLGNDEIQAAMKKRIDPARISIVEAGAFAQAKAGKPAQ
jgi:zinc protease